MVVNGDVFEWRSMRHLPERDRVEAVVGVLTRIQRAARVPTYFNLGNHDELKVVHEGVTSISPEFTMRLVYEVNRSGITVIGFNPAGIYPVRIADRGLLISHYPFAKTLRIERQSARFAHDRRAVAKVTEVPDRARFAGNTLVMSDSHTPLADPAQGVYNTGKLAYDANLPDEPNTFFGDPGGGSPVGSSRSTTTARSA